MKLSPVGINTKIGLMWESPETPGPGAVPSPPPSSPQSTVGAGQQVVEDVEGGLVGRALGNTQLLQQQRLVEVGELGSSPEGPAPTKTPPRPPASSLLLLQGRHGDMRVSCPPQGIV